MLAKLKLVISFISSYRIWFYLAGALTFLITGFTYIQNHGEMKERIPALEDQLASCQDASIAKDGQLIFLNQRIKKNNERELQALAEAAEKIKTAQDIAAVIVQEREQAKEELAVARFRLLENIRDDEDMADWANYDVPSDAWDRLWDIIQGSTTD